MSYRKRSLRNRSLPSSVLILTCICLIGCRGPLNPFGSYSRGSAEPSFDRLIELEGASEAGNAASTHRQVTQRRPGGNAAAARYAHDTASPASSRSSLAARASQRSISDDSIDDLEDTPQEQRELLQKTQVALNQRSETSSTLRKPRVPSSDETSSGDQTVAIRMTDHETSIEGTQEDDATDRAVQVASATRSGPSATQEPAVGPAAYNRYEGRSAELQSTSPGPDSVSADPVDLKWDEHLRLAMQQLSEMSSQDAATGKNPKQQIQLEVVQRMLALAIGDREQMTMPIEGMQPQEQDYIRYQLTALLDAIDPEANPVSARKWSLVMLSQRKAHDYLASVCNLEVNNLSFCTEVESFGVIEKFQKYQFSADQEVLLYCELDNFVSERAKDGGAYETQLQGSYEIIDSSGARVADQQLPTDTHVCRNRRRDYFIAYRIYTPANIKAGNYTLKLTIEDVKGHKFGQSDIEFQVQ